MIKSKQERVKALSQAWACRCQDPGDNIGVLAVFCRSSNSNRGSIGTDTELLGPGLIQDELAIYSDQGMIS